MILSREVDEVEKQQALHELAVYGYCKISDYKLFNKKRQTNKFYL
jgi:hypothetical protein